MQQYDDIVLSLAASQNCYSFVSYIYPTKCFFFYNFQFIALYYADDWGDVYVTEFFFCFVKI